MLCSEVLCACCESRHSASCVAPLLAAKEKGHVRAKVLSWWFCARARAKAGIKSHPRKLCLPAVVCSAVLGEKKGGGAENGEKKQKVGVLKVESAVCLLRPRQKAARRAVVWLLGCVCVC